MNLSTVFEIIQQVVILGDGSQDEQNIVRLKLYAAFRRQNLGVPCDGCNHDFIAQMQILNAFPLAERGGKNLKFVHVQVCAANGMQLDGKWRKGTLGDGQFE